MDKNFENLIAEYVLNFKEIRSYIVVLQQAIQNEFSETNLSDIDNSLAIIIERIDNIIKNINEIENNYTY